MLVGYMRVSFESDHQTTNLGVGMTEFSGVPAYTPIMASPLNKPFIFQNAFRLLAAHPKIHGRGGKGSMAQEILDNHHRHPTAKKLNRSSVPLIPLTG